MVTEALAFVGVCALVICTPFLQRARVRRTFDAVTGTVLVAFGIRLATATR
jgi:threonine/homoserine/homoserine lactone efflux protein